MQDVPILERHHTAMTGKVRIRRQHTELHQTLMRIEHVKVISEIIGGKFPRAIYFPHLWYTDEFDLTRAAKDDIHVPTHVAQPVIQRWGIRVPGSKHQATLGAQSVSY